VLQDPLCVLPALPSAGCCDASAAPPAVPNNPPGLAAIQYRIGTFTSFRQAMLDEVADPNLLAALGNPINPFAGWHAGTAGDYQTMFIELWAYLADILTFYQERIANEAYLPTATQRDSLMRLAQLIDYRPNPGAAASALLAFTVAKGQMASVPASFRVSSKPSAGQPAAVFETAAALSALGDYSAIPLSSVAPTNQFAPLTDYALFFSELKAELLAGAASDIYGNVGATYLRGFAGIGGIADIGSIAARSVASRSPLLQGGGLGARASRPPGSAASIVGRSPLLQLGVGGIRPFPPGTIFWGGFFSTTVRTIVLQGTNNRLAIGDHVLVVENQGSGAQEVATLHQLTSVSTDKTANTTTITWDEEAGKTYDQSVKPVTIYALRVTAGPFGNTAPNWYSLPFSLTNDGGPYENEPWDTPTNSDGTPNPWYYLPMPADASINPPAGQPGDPQNVVYLDSTYAGIKATPDNPDWAVLMTDGTTNVFHVTDARPASKAAYAISAKVTRLTLDSNLPATTFPLRNTTILSAGEALTLQNNLPLPDPLAGATLILAGQYPRLQAGQTVVVQGTIIQSNFYAAGTTGAEAGILAGPPVVDTTNNLTTITLKQSLSNQYTRAGAVLLANVVGATQGETVRDEVLGSSDGSALQAYPLKQKPLTYLPSTDPEGLAAVSSTLLVTVNQVRWSEQPTLLTSGANAQDYTTSLDDTGQTTVHFGDGINGARPPTGQANIHARYRKGLGTSGNVAAGGISQLVDSAPGLQKVTNPQPALGGADQESADQIRVNAPASVRTFGRAVSAADYAALALSYPGVAKASAVWMLRDPITFQAIAQPYVQLTVATADEVPLAQQPTFAAKLRSFLDKRRDPNMPLRILDFTPVYIDVAATVDILDQYPRQATYNAVLAALNPGLNPDGTAGYFAFQRRQFGQSIHLSAVYAALQDVPGVADALITTLRRLDLDPDPATVRNDIFIRPTELAVIENDPADTGNQFGKLTITLGVGGYADA
jgi:predicted phage baseplate assembly protein